ncbi:MAG TPA: SRPBCC domain-containing protein [Puia sp.]|jgi:uncharacterized protein YndB with AHSA1/START domain|nr:SRPBCC domain-containing protein [Puia sp.]HEV3414697.1 SRPBCC domain-containing protein [Puia sp.]
MKQAIMKHEAKFTKDLPGNKLHVSRAYDAPIEKVWRAWTQNDILDQWWAPRPFKAETKSMEFRPGGLWHYCMVGPNGERHWCRVAFEAVVPGKSFTATSGFCDEHGTPNNTLPLMHWHTRFLPTATGTTIDVTITFDKEADLQAIVQMGFEGGFTMGLNNLEEWLDA